MGPFLLDAENYFLTAFKPIFLHSIDLYEQHESYALGTDESSCERYKKHA